MPRSEYFSTPGPDYFVVLPTTVVESEVPKPITVVHPPRWVTATSHAPLMPAPAEPIDWAERDQIAAHIDRLLYGPLPDDL